MNSRGLKAAVFAASTLMASALLSGGAAQAAPQVPMKAPAASISHTQVDSQEALEAYWTPERMKSAKPGNTINSQGWGEQGRSIMPKAGTEAQAAPQQKAAPSTRAGSPAPVSHIGKVFFTLGGQNYVCSANSVQSTNQSTVATAGHCTYDINAGWASKFVFVPAYNNGSAPYGMWSATSLHSTTEWVSRNDISYDGAFAVVAPLNGRTLTAAVGASKIGFNLARGLTYTAYGYPAASPFNGETLKSCYGTASRDRIGGTQSQGIPCDMTGGSSGGPWFVGSGSGGTQNSVNSFGYNIQKNVMYGPYFGSSIQTAYSTASNR
ncbi:trypsin-like serine peptidase [Arthrobacter sp. D2-10]